MRRTEPTPSVPLQTRVLSLPKLLSLTRLCHGLAVMWMALLFPTQSYATFVIPVTDADLIQQAEAIVQGEVTAITSVHAPQHNLNAPQIFTFVRLSIQDVLKGQLMPQRSLTIKQPGGAVGDSQYWVEGSPEFFVGEKVVLFLSQHPDGSPRVTQFYQGKLTIMPDPDTGKEFVYRESPPPGVHVLNKKNASRQTSLVYLFHELEALKVRIRSVVNTTPQSSPKQFLVSPSPLRVSQAKTQSHAKFTFLGPGRWHEPQNGQPVRMKLNTRGEPAASDQGFASVREAFQAWNMLGDSSFRYEDAGFTNDRGLRSDGENTVTFRDPLNQIDPPVNCSGMLALGGFFSKSSSGSTIDGQFFPQITEGDLVISEGWEGCGFYENPKNLAEVLTHELGHVLGLGHSTDPRATMYAFAHFDGRGAALRSDDIAGLAFLYPPRYLSDLWDDF